MRKRLVPGTIGLLAAAAVGAVATMAAMGGAAAAADPPQVFTLKGARLTQSGDVMRNGELVATDFSIGPYKGHAVLDAKGGATWVAGPCRFVVTPGEDREGYDLGWTLTAHALAGGACPGVANGRYVPPK